MKSTTLKMIILLTAVLGVTIMTSEKVSAATCPNSPYTESWRDPRCNLTEKDYKDIYNLGKWAISCAVAANEARKGNPAALVGCLP